MGAGSAMPGLFFTFSAMVLLIFVGLSISVWGLLLLIKFFLKASVSAPTWNSISFLNANAGGTVTHFGVFGYTGSGTSVGWYFPPELACVYLPRFYSTLSYQFAATLN